MCETQSGINSLFKKQTNIKLPLTEIMFKESLQLSFIAVLLITIQSTEAVPLENEAPLEEEAKSTTHSLNMVSCVK